MILACNINYIIIENSQYLAYAITIYNNSLAIFMSKLLIINSNMLSEDGT